jgi:CDGSH-type Zn-finger protein
MTIEPNPSTKEGNIMKKSEIVLTQYSPLMAVDTELAGSDGSPIETTRVYSLCRCGESKFKPLCDGSHAQAEFVGEREKGEKPPVEYYEGKEITIVYDRYLCMGAGYCGELEAVFGTHDAPKYEPDAAPAEEIIATIKKCPSGALTYIIDGKLENEYFQATRIVVEKDGPLHCQGEIELKDDQSSETLLPNADHYTLCRCGGSKKKPLCDGSHEEINFRGE